MFTEDALLKTKLLPVQKSQLTWMSSIEQYAKAIGHFDIGFHKHSARVRPFVDFDFDKLSLIDRESTRIEESSLIFEIFTFASATAVKFIKSTAETRYVVEIFVNLKIAKTPARSSGSVNSRYRSK